MLLLFCFDHRLIFWFLRFILFFGVIYFIEVDSCESGNSKFLQIVVIVCCVQLKHFQSFLARQILTDFETGLRLWILILFAPLSRLHYRSDRDCWRLGIRFVIEIGSCWRFEAYFGRVEWLRLLWLEVFRLARLIWFWLFFSRVNFFLWTQILHFDFSYRFEILVLTAFMRQRWSRPMLILWSLRNCLLLLGQSLGRISLGAVYHLLGGLLSFGLRFIMCCKIKLFLFCADTAWLVIGGVRLVQWVGSFSFLGCDVELWW